MSCNLMFKILINNNNLATIRANIYLEPIWEEQNDSPQATNVFLSSSNDRNNLLMWFFCDSMKSVSVLKLFEKNAIQHVTTIPVHSVIPLDCVSPTVCHFIFVKILFTKYSCCFVFIKD